MNDDLATRVAHLAARVRLGRVPNERVQLASACGDGTATALLGAPARLEAPDDPLGFGLHVHRTWGPDAAAAGALAVARHVIAGMGSDDGARAALERLVGWWDERPIRPATDLPIPISSAQQRLLAQAARALRGLPWSAGLALGIPRGDIPWSTVRGWVEEALRAWALLDARSRPGAQVLYDTGRIDPGALRIAALADDDEARSVCGLRPARPLAFNAWLQAIADHGHAPAVVVLMAVATHMTPFIGADGGSVALHLYGVEQADEWLWSQTAAPPFHGGGEDYAYAPAWVIGQPAMAMEALRMSTRAATFRLAQAHPDERQPAPEALARATERLRRIMSEALVAWALPWW